ncbi:ThiF family adenylyltransferase [Sphingobacterium suaedae]|uniref:ThiF family adenylyltransferase n=1 Tax=Sphingobacterium suaedae TaxID=1686402 RepID=A0ABW5KFN5_9SPHI
MTKNLERYRCQINLPHFGVDTQNRLANAKVLIIGAGGLGCPTAQYLAASGLGTIGLADDDIISMDNLHRQILYTPADIGKRKVDVAAERLRQQNPAIHVATYPMRVTADNVMDLIADYDIIVEGTDNFETKGLLNDACVLSGKPLVYGAIYQYEGQVSIWNVRQPDGSYSANYRDVFPEVEEAQVPNCREGGVIPTLAGIIGSMQANEVLKYFSQPAATLSGKLWMINVIDGTCRTIRLKKSTGTIISTLPTTTPVVDWSTFKKMPEKFELIDVRNTTEHDAFDIGGRSIPLPELPFTSQQLAEVSRPILFYCTSGARSAAAVRYMKQHYPQKAVYSLKDGLQHVDGPPL